MNDAQFWVQVAATVFIAFTFLVYLLQLRAMRSASTSQNILSVLNYLQDAEVREARRLVLTQLKEKPLASWTEDERRAASLVYSTYDMAGILIRRGFVPKDLFVSNWGESIVRCYKILEPFLKELHINVPGTKYGAHLKWLCEEAERHGNSLSV
jgi:hypothetical protein